MPFEAGNKLRTGRPKNSLNKVTATNKNFLKDLLFNQDEFEKDYRELDLNGRMELRIKMCQYILPKAKEEPFVPDPKKYGIPFEHLMKSISFKK
jgi:hypothetical protein